MNGAVVKKTQDTLGKVIKKPPLTDKLLGKPPFRYLHDIFSEVIRTTGFMKGLYVENDMKSDNVKEHARRFAVPSYEEVVGSGQYPIRQSNLRQSSTHLPSYEDLVEQADGLQFENEGLEGVAVAVGDPAAPAAEGAAPNRRAGKAARKLLHNKIRRIKSEKLHLKNVDNSQAPAGLSIEPLTPPPQYEDKVPPI